MSTRLAVAPSPGETQTASPTVLLVMGDTSNRASMMQFFRSQGWEVRLAGDAVSAQTVARRENPDVILIGARLPAGGSLAAVQRLKRNVHTAAIPVVLVEEEGGASTQEGTPGVDSRISGGADLEEMVRVIGGHLEAPPAPDTAPTEVIEDTGRLAELRSSGLLDEAFDPDLDALTQIAVQLVDAPVALVSLVDNDRQYFKSHVGLGDPWASHRQTALSHSFCQWVVSSAEELAVDDARDHPVLKRNLAVRDLGVVAYAGSPILTGSGQALGSMCAIDSEPREWTRAELAILKSLSRLVEGLSTTAPQGASESQRASAVRALARGMYGGTQLLCRYGSRLTEPQREQLLLMLDGMSTELVGLTSSTG